ncbi:hypothetical protein JCM11641_004831 [Rhodosporidiobolus odoratus]
MPRPCLQAPRRCPSQQRTFATTPASRAKSSSLPKLNSRPLRFGIVGGGPAGFYAASRLLSLPGSDKATVDLFELLPSPFGLARFGVAPDHPEVKNCEHKFEETARDPRFRFFGNIQVGSSASSFSSSAAASASPTGSSRSLAAVVSLEALRPHYDALLFTYGASLDRPLNVPGESTLSNVFSARSFVNWYNGHPYHAEALSPLLDLSKHEHVTVIGQGNVALDLARMLLKPVDALREFDVPDYALAELSRSRVKHVDVVGRRGPLQLAATTKELRELMNVPGVAFDMDSALLQAAGREVEDNPTMESGRMRKRAMGLLKGGSKTSMAEAGKSWSLQFLQSPVELLASSSTPSAVGGVRYALNELIPPSTATTVIDPNLLQARPTGEMREQTTDMVFKSVGYRSIGIAGLPFDEKRGVVRNKAGRVVDEQGETVGGLYTSGWLARGPTGVVATTMFDAFAAADLIASDFSSPSTSSTSAATAASVRPPLPIEELRGSARVVSWEDWERIDKVERERGREKGKIREKFTSVKEMLDVLS